MNTFEELTTPSTQRTFHGTHFRYIVEIHTLEDGSKWTKIHQEGFRGENPHEVWIDQDIGFALVRALQDLGAAPPPPEPPRKRRGFSGKHMFMRERNTKNSWSAGEDCLLIALYTEGAPLNELALCLGRTAFEIQDRLRKFSFSPNWEDEEFAIYRQQHAP